MPYVNINVPLNLKKDKKENEIIDHIIKNLPDDNGKNTTKILILLKLKKIQINEKKVKYIKPFQQWRKQIHNQEIEKKKELRRIK